MGRERRKRRGTFETVEWLLLHYTFLNHKMSSKAMKDEEEKWGREQRRNDTRG